MADAVLVLEDGRVFRGTRFGAIADEAVGEVVFNTAMTGYQEVLSDPSYAGQMVLMTAPMMGNVGLAPEDYESSGPALTALLVKEPSRLASNWRQERDLETYLTQHGVVGLCGFDTRALTRHLRAQGSLRGVIASADRRVDALVARARAVPSIAGRDLATIVTTQRRYAWSRPSFMLEGSEGARRKEASRRDFHVVTYDFGVKRNILRRLVDEGCAVTVVPAHTTAKEVLALRPAGVLLSNGPGNPEPVGYAVEAVKQLLGRVPIFGICLGHQLLGLAAGGRTYKLRCGHHGQNHPVMDLQTRRVEITTHNHGFSVDADSFPAGNVEVTHRDLNDQSVEGLRLLDVPAFSVQYHPEAAAGPHDSSHLFRRFVSMMAEYSPAAE